jgi:hypothetical protein
VEDPVELVPDIPVELGPHEAFLRGQHIVIPGVTGAGGVKKPDRSLYLVDRDHTFLSIP